MIARLGSLRFIAWAMLASTVFIVAQFLLTRPLAALAVPGPIHAISLAMAIFATVLPTWLIAESIKRMGANAASLVGSLGPVFTIGLGAMILGEPIHAIQLAGAALVLGGVMLVTWRPGVAGPDWLRSLPSPSRFALPQREWSIRATLTSGSKHSANRADPAGSSVPITSLSGAFAGSRWCDPRRQGTRRQ